MLLRVQRILASNVPPCVKAISWGLVVEKRAVLVVGPFKPSLESSVHGGWIMAVSIHALAKQASGIPFLHSEVLDERVGVHFVVEVKVADCARSAQQRRR